jgi:hypothetical protein
MRLNKGTIWWRKAEGAKIQAASAPMYATPINDFEDRDECASRSYCWKSSLLCFSPRAGVRPILYGLLGLHEGCSSEVERYGRLGVEHDHNSRSFPPWKIRRNTRAD